MKYTAKSNKLREIKNSFRSLITSRFINGILLLIIPGFYFITGSYFRELLGDLSLRSVDPDYIYYISGITISEGEFILNHIDNPGTPLQYLVAVIFRIVYLLRSTNVSYLEDVFTHPDLYLSTVNIFLTGLISLASLYTGKKIYRHTKSFIYAVLIQTAPLIPAIWYDIIGRVTPELLLPIPILLLSSYLIKIHQANRSFNQWEDVIILSLICAFGLSVKLSFISILFIPLFIISRRNKKISFIFMTFILFLIFALPATLQFSRFFGWIKKLFVHSGQYGRGDDSIIHLPVFFEHLGELFQTERFFIYRVIVLLIIATAGFFLIQRKKVRHPVLISFALLSSVIIQIIIVCKHFEHRYFIPSLLLSPLLVYFIAEMIKTYIKRRLFQKIVMVCIVLLLIWKINRQFSSVRARSRGIGKEVESRKETRHFISMLGNNNITIICSKSYGCPYKQYCLMFSYCWASHRRRPAYKSVLSKLYPNTYQYFTFDNTLKYWSEKLTLEKLTDTTKNVILYLEKNDTELYDRSIKKLQNEVKIDFHCDSILLYENQNNQEVLYRLKIF
jgi:hypothetical protein